MKRFFQILVIVMIATTSGSCTSPPDRSDLPEKKEDPSNIIIPQPGIKRYIPLSLPKYARVWLKNETSQSGQVVGIDGQELTIEAGNSRRSHPIDQIDRVELLGEWFRVNGCPSALSPAHARENSKSCIRMREPKKRKVFLVQIDEFKWEDSESGIARIEREEVEQGVIPRDDSHYEVTEMRFIPEEGQMEITAALVRPRSGDS